MTIKAADVMARDAQLLTLAKGDEYREAWVNDLVDLAEAMLEDERVAYSLRWRRNPDDIAEELQSLGRPVPRLFIPPDRALLRFRKEMAKRPGVTLFEQDAHAREYYAADPERTVPLSCPFCGAPVGGRFREHQCPHICTAG